MLRKKITGIMMPVIFFITCLTEVSTPVPKFKGMPVQFSAVPAVTIPGAISFTYIQSVTQHPFDNNGVTLLLNELMISRMPFSEGWPSSQLINGGINITGSLYKSQNILPNTVVAHFEVAYGGSEPGYRRKVLYWNRLTQCIHVVFIFYFGWL